MGKTTLIKPTKLKELAELIKRASEDMAFYEYVSAGGTISVELPVSLLSEATHAQVGRHDARRDPPHFAGDVYHGHCPLPGGYEVSWDMTGKRRHPNKFPAHVPADAKAAVAKVLKVPVGILEAYWFDENGQKKLLLEAWEPDWE